MKKATIYIYLILSALIYWGCDKPAPTEFLDVEEQLQVEVISKNPDDEFYSNGFDSTGITENPTRYTNLISVSGIKTTRNSSTVKSSFAQAVFFDKNSPIFSPGGRLLGYKTRTPGIIKFNNTPARLHPFKIRFRGHGGPADTTLGFNYILSSGRMQHSDNFNFEFNSSVKFDYLPILPANNFSFNIPTPPEIFSTAKLSGKFVEKNLNVLLEWNKSDYKKFEIIVGAFVKNKQEMFPLFRITTRDDGRLVIPSKLINQIPADRFDKLVFSLVRKYESDNTGNPVELHVVSQSIHSIVIENP